MPTAIHVDQLTKTYSEGLVFRKRHHALRGVSLEVKPGEVFGLLGPNGAGKTTLIKILLGILHANRGSATVLDLNAGSKAARRKIGYLPENLIFPRHHSGRSALYFYGRLSGLSETQIRSKENELFQLVDLTGRQNEPVRRYSKGMRQRLGLAQAMLHDPDLLILDEPTDGLDPMGRSQIRDLLAQLKSRGKTVFLNSHILQEVELICDRVAIMALGEIRGVGTIDELIMQNPLAQQGTVNLTLRCPQDTINSLSQRWTCTSVRRVPSPTEEYKVDIAAPHQSDVDQVIDWLRSQQISIVSLERYRPSLEQVFMSIVGSVPSHLKN
ncbi:MAG: ABC transporter ATP-binding protein [Pirellula sp.]|jgi:ABC-2 type transport system ATP-binding protein